MVPRIWAICASETLSPVMPSLSCSAADMGRPGRAGRQKVARRSPAGTYGLIGKILEWDRAMDKAFKQPMFVVGLPLTICGFVFGLTGLLVSGTLAYVAPGFLIPGLVFMVIGWQKRDK